MQNRCYFYSLRFFKVFLILDKNMHYISSAFEKQTLYNEIIIDTFSLFKPIFIFWSN